MATSDKKLFLGGRLKRLRRDLGVTQSAMAEQLKVSPSYLNLLERNQRPVTAQVLLRLAEAYDLDLRSLSADEPGGGAGLEEVLADKMFADLALSRHEVAEVAELSPSLAEAFVRLYRAYLDRGNLIDLGAFEGRDGPTGPTPTDWVRDLVGAQRNHFAELEELAEQIVADLGVDPRDLTPALRDRLLEAHSVRTRVMPVEIMAGALRRFDRHRKQLLVSETMAPASRTFAMAYQLGLIEQGDAIAQIADRYVPPDRATREQLKVFLGNYLAAAVMMPYGRFLAALEETGYDIERVRSRFGVSFEQAAHRLTTLARSGARGIPFFMVRVDAAGNISKRYSSGPFPFSRFGGTCPRWNVHDSFKTPGRIVTQVIETPDGERYFTLSRTVRRVAGLLAGLEDELAVGLGCELKHAGKLVYARGLDIVSPAIVEVGPACRICERRNCPQRAAAPVNRKPLVEESVKSVTSFPFAP
ncbi:putative transcriptional regulator/DNA-binding XRE family transcriptional regulator [Caulobacter ginsengisoli]|uniref:Transcriptional regulator/DNA-binding XRE family transcriptional regulator n=1 Tax=Caulobacter ginsengisoli TaxID=400775 RepID=A0ABU0INY7_9CAUL|nr:short-chain fatty acyl-CoA regulator family protein [Caulobacter ginsengisoli]MDQ0463704.1 putative transcriptional regulator/DNA-binding XRE family transcriptional regulator [Caulobacter ginsengisoli]